jgi:N-acetylneuraminic acid mutarotase
MKPMIALLALLMAACGGDSGGLSGVPTTPTAPTMPTVPSLPTTQVDGGQWTQRAPLIEANSESQPNNHGMAAGVNGRVYLIGGQTMADAPTYVDTVYELNPATGAWVEKARMPTARSSGVAVVHDGKIYVAGGRPPRGSDFAVYDTRSDSWQVLPALPTQRNHFTGAAIEGRIHFVGGRQGDGLSPQMTTAHEIFDPRSGSWTNAAAMLRARSGMNGVLARGCFHVWGGEGPAGMFPDHDYYDPRTNQWIHLRDMPLAVHGVYGSAFVDGLIWASGGGTNIGGSHGSLHNQVFFPTVSCD